GRPGQPAQLAQCPGAAARAGRPRGRPGRPAPPLLPRGDRSPQPRGPAVRGGGPPHGAHGRVRPRPVAEGPGPPPPPAAGGRLGMSLWASGKSFWPGDVGRKERPQPAVLEGHRHWVCQVAFAPDGRTLVSAGGALDQAGEIILWDLATGRAKFLPLVGIA